MMDQSERCQLVNWLNNYHGCQLGPSQGIPAKTAVIFVFKWAVFSFANIDFHAISVSQCETEMS